MEAAPIFKELADRKAVVEVFRTVLARHGIELEMDHMDFHLRDKMITELSYKPAGLSEMVLDHCFRKSLRQAQSITTPDSEDFRGLSLQESFGFIQCANDSARVASWKHLPRRTASTDI